MKYRPKAWQGVVRIAPGMGLRRFTEEKILGGLGAQLLCVIFAVVLPLAIFEVFDIQNSIEEWKDQELDSSYQLAGAIGQGFLNSVQNLWSMQLSLGLALIQDGDLRVDHETAETIMRGLLLDNPILNGMAVIDHQGQILASTYPGGRGQDAIPHRYVQAILAGEKNQVSDLYEGPAGGSSFRVAQGIYEEGVLQGLIVGFVDPSRLELVLPGGKGNGQPAYGLLDGRGQIVYWNQPSLPSKGRIEAEAIRVDLPLPGLDWAAVVSTPVDDIMAKAWKHATRRGVVVLGLGIISMSLALSLSGQILRKARILQAAAQRISRGDFSTRVNISGSDELAVIGSSFDEMAQRLEEAEARRIEAEERRELQEEAIRQSEQRFRLLVDGVKDYGIYQVDTQGLITSWNRGAVRIKGYEAEEVLGKHLSVFYENRTREEVDQMLQEALVGDRLEDSGWSLRKGGGRFWVDRSITPLFDSQGQHQGYAVVSRDVTAKAKFVQIAAHEMRNPMTGILGILKLLLRNHEGEGPNHLLSVMKREVERLSAMLNRILEAFRLQEGEIDSRKECLDYRQVIHRALEPYAVEPIHMFQVSVGESPVSVFADPRDLETVWRNLISNAVKYSPCGGVIQIKLWTEDERVLASIEDPGVGIALDEQQRIFEHFYRAPSIGDQDPGGMGLGLYICREIVRHYHGRIWVESSISKGSKFTVMLPKCEGREECQES